jgi:hypothetical protein
MSRGNSLKAKTLSTAPAWCGVQRGGKYGVVEG